MSGKKTEDDSIQTSAEAAEAAVFPEAGAAHTQGWASAETQPLPPGMAKKPVAKKSPAEWAYERMILYIQTFEEQIESEEEVAIGHVGGGTGVLRVEGMGYFAPDLITFYGTDEAGLQTQLVQHVSQLNVMLRAMPKPRDAEAANRIGFRLREEMEKGTQA